MQQWASASLWMANLHFSASQRSQTKHRDIKKKKHTTPSGRDWPPQSLNFNIFEAVWDHSDSEHSSRHQRPKKRFECFSGRLWHIDSYIYWQLISLLLILSLTACGNSPFSPVFGYSTLTLRLLAGVCYSPPLCLCARLCPHRLSLQECDLLQLLSAQDSL